MEEPEPSNFYVGETFNSLEDLESKIKIFQQENFVQLWKPDCRLLASAIKGNRLSKAKKCANKKLVYSEVKYSCVHGGQKFTSRGTGKRAS